MICCSLAGDFLAILGLTKVPFGKYFWVLKQIQETQNPLCIGNSQIYIIFRNPYATAIKAIPRDPLLPSGEV